MKGRKKQILTQEIILSKISEYDIYRFYLGRDFKVNRPIASPMPGRKDDNPSFLIGNKHGFLYHIDFGDSYYRGRCFDFVKQIRLLVNNYDVLKLIDRDFGLGILDDTEIKDYKQIVAKYKPDIQIVKEFSLIQCKARKFFHTDELLYWKSYFQTENDLREEQVYPLTEVWINKVRVSISPTEMVFGYLYEDKWKIYRPFAKNKKEKWRTNVPIDLMDGLENVKGCDKALITKAKKDKMVIRKIFPCVASVQNESVVAINPENLDFIKKNSREQWINFDSDAPGKKASWSYTTEFNFKHINVPDSLFPIKDFADMAKEKGLEAVREHFKLKGLI
jgi:hypothetical protein